MPYLIIQHFLSDIMSKTLSPTAQAVLDAYGNQVGGSAAITSYERRGLAAALQAAVDQAVPEEPLHGGDQRWMWERDARQERRKKLLAIAFELEENHG